VAIACAIAVAMQAPGARAATLEGPPSEAQLRAYETAVLGPEHAAEHAAERRALARAARSKPRKGNRKPRKRRRGGRGTVKLNAFTGGPDWQVGRWTTGPFRIPTFAIHAAVLPTGEVMFWGYPPAVTDPRPNSGEAWLWNPSKGTGRRSLTNIEPPRIDADGDKATEPTPLYCSGENFLADGRLLLTGGNGRWPDFGVGQDYIGLNSAYTFNPWNRRWTLQPKMTAGGRWYPGQVTMPDGRTLVMGGYSDIEPGGVFNDTTEVFTPSPDMNGQGTFEHVPSADRRTALYPHLLTMPSGEIFLAGPARGDSALLNTTTFTWRKIKAPVQSRVGGTIVRMNPTPVGTTQVRQIGGYDPQPGPPENLGPGPDAPAVATSETVDVSEGFPIWRTDVAQMHFARSYHNTTVLPDGSMVTVGGGRGNFDPEQNYSLYADRRTRKVELWDSSTGTWRLGPSEVEDRAYHSTAVLLPDGRVWSAGDDFHPDKIRDSAEIYSPPYLFKGARPRITAAPSTLAWDATFNVTARGNPVRAVMMAPNAVTHADEMNARLIPLRLGQKTAGALTLQAPPNANVAPPGYYMLFVLNEGGVPSVARWVRLGAA
jgi:hypothetical protein